MSIGNLYPEHSDDFVAPLPEARPNLFRNIQTVVTDTPFSRYDINRLTADMQQTAPSIVDAVRQQHDATTALAAHYGNSLMRLIQAQTAFDDVFFEGVSRADAQLRAFMSGDGEHAGSDCPPAEAWREQFRGFQPLSQLRLPGFLKHFGVEVTPRIRTILPEDLGSIQTGYLQTSGEYRGQPYGQHDPIDLESIGTAPASLWATVDPSARLTPPQHPAIVTGPDYGRKLSEFFLTEHHKLFSSRRLTKALAVDAVTVVPGIAQTGAIVSTDLCVNLGWQSFEDEVQSPGAYHVALLKNGVPQNERVIDPASDGRLLGSSSQNPFFCVPPARSEELREWRDNDPFTREYSDMHLSVVGIPVTVLDSRNDPRYTPTRPAVKYEHDDRTAYLQRDRGRAPFMANVAVFASY